MITPDNNVNITGRLTRDPDIRYTQGSQGDMEIARFTLAVDRGSKTKDGKREADFISCVAFGKPAEFFEKYGRQGMKVGVLGRIQTGSYEKQDGTKVYTTDVVVETVSFREPRSDAQEGASDARDDRGQGNYHQNPQNNQQNPSDAFKMESYSEGFMDVSGYSGESVPFA